MKTLVQNPAPDFTAKALVDGDFQTISMDQYRGQFVVLLFYPLNFTFVCPTELIAFGARKGDFDKRNVQLLGCSTDSEYSHLAWSTTPRDKGGIEGIEFPLIADVTREIARQYRVLIDEGIALRGLFIIDAEGIIRHITMNDLPIGRSVGEVLRVIDAIQFTDQHGEVCPANWMPGSDTIVPEPNASRTFFSNINS